MMCNVDQTHVTCSSTEKSMIFKWIGTCPLSTVFRTMSTGPLISIASVCGLGARHGFECFQKTSIMEKGRGVGPSPDAFIIVCH